MANRARFVNFKQIKEITRIYIKLHENRRLALSLPFISAPGAPIIGDFTKIKANDKAV